MNGEQIGRMIELRVRRSQTFTEIEDTNAAILRSRGEDRIVGTEAETRYHIHVTWGEALQAHR